jgi:hypothetical protein
MPPIIVWAAGTLGALALAKLISRAARRANAELDAIRSESAAERPIEKLERDPVSGTYRPRR